MRKLWNKVRRWLIRNISVNGRDNFIQIGTVPLADSGSGWDGWDEWDEWDEWEDYQ